MDASTFLLGALGGLLGTAAKLPIELAVRARYGLEGLLDWERNQTVMGRLTRRSVEASALPGLATQFSHGLARGLIFVLVLFLVPAQALSPLLGVAYGLVLFALVLAGHRRLTHKAIRARPHPAVAAGTALATYLVYGVVLALVVLGL